jgi:NAD(P)-dependent dehydrogenase (short-subunit alcohol dehydrogenase family)
MPLALILGASGGIGSALSRRLKNDGWTLHLASRNADKLKPLAQELEASYSVCDVTKSDEVERLFDELSEAPDAVAHCVGSILLKPAHLTKDDEWAQTLNQNLNSAFFVTRSSAKKMKEKGGSVVLFSSVASRIGLVNHEAIAAAKAGVEGLALSAAASYANFKVRFNVIAPGLVRTPLSARITQNEASLKASEALHPLGRIGEPEDIASLAAWLMSPEQSWVTGQVIAVDGGLSRLKLNRG